MVVIEGQQIYGRGIPGASNELLFLAQMVGGVLARVDHFEHRIVLPRVWTGGVPKPVRQRRFLSQCSDRERAMIEAIKPASKRHNAIDAITMGAWHLGRLRAPNIKDEIQ